MLYAQTSAVRFVEAGFPLEVSVERSGTHFHPSKEIEEACGGFTIARELSVAGEFVARMNGTRRISTKRRELG